MSNTPQLVDQRHVKKGGWKGVIEICHSSLTYDQKVRLIEEKYGVASRTATRWISLVKEK